ncbi:MAG TPA: DUF6600 domain-containing protein [Candidatus Binatia bacterium]|nr:DUF6600 domain-containing protein [Candidatus Binatia bacterium]
MNRAKLLGGRFGIVLCGALLGYTAHGQPSVSVGVSVPLPSVEVALPGVQIRAESDFYEPLTPYGRWEVVGSYGRCWIPGRVEADWRPYCEGYWQRTDAGWYWASDEPWAWATYHYGRWDLSPRFGWYWVPQTQWAPAWVSWHSGGGYVGWAPLYPSGVRVISPRAYVFVEERHFMEPVRRSTLVVNNTTIINKTVIIEAPATAVIEKASGRTIQAVPVQELRHKQEAAVVAQQRSPVSAGEKRAPTPVNSQAAPGEKKTVIAHVPPQADKPTASTRDSTAPAPKITRAQPETRKSVPATPAPKPAAKPEARTESTHAVANKEPVAPKANQQPAQQEKAAKPSDKKTQPSAGEKPAASPSAPGPAEKSHDNKSKD